jgi:PTH1 family peptidyl-tRNA hydrolase
MPDSPDTLGHGIRLIAGLGNPGKEYDGTRHNIGFAVLDLLASRFGINFCKETKWDAFVARSNSQGTHPDLSLLKPTTYMNLSGEAVGEYARFYRIPPQASLIVIDDVALPLGTLRLRRDGGSGGQNGLKSVLVHFATEQVPRLRVGIGGAKSSERGENDLSHHVLSRFHADEQHLATEAISRAADAISCILNQGMDHAMNLYNAAPVSATVLQPKQP